MKQLFSYVSLLIFALAFGKSIHAMNPNPDRYKDELKRVYKAKRLSLPGKVGTWCMVLSIVPTLFIETERDEVVQAECFFANEFLKARGQEEIDMQMLRCIVKRLKTEFEGDVSLNDLLDNLERSIEEIREEVVFREDEQERLQYLCKKTLFKIGTQIKTNNDKYFAVAVDL